MSSDSQRREETGLYKIIFVTTNDAILAADLDDIITKCNPAAARMFGYSQKELIGMDQKNMVWDDEDKEKLIREHRARAEGEQSRYELRWKRKDGEMLYTEVRASPRHRNGVYTGNFGLLTDITQDKINKNIKEVNICHEIKNCLTPIVGGIDILEHEIDKPSHLEILNLVREAAGDIESITETILNYGTSLNRKRINYDLNSFIQERIEFMKIDKTFDYFIFKRELHNSSLPVKMDLLAVKSVFENIIRNAAKNSEAGTIITIGTQPGAGGQSAEFYIADQGFGIAPENIGRLFDLNYTQGGHGIGLYFANKYIKEHGGYIKVDSTLGEGSRFTVGIPLINRNT